MKKFNKVLKITVITFSSLLIIFIIGAYSLKDSFLKAPPNLLSVHGEDQTVDITWRSEEQSERAALLIQVKDSLPLYFQIDIGSPYSMIYSSFLESKYKDIISFSSRTESVLRDLRFDFQNIHISGDSIRVIQSGGYDSTSMILVGTLGSDFFAHRHAIFDFKKSTFEILNKRPLEIKSPLIEIELVNRWVMIPAIVDGDEKSLMWDTGASAFGLITDKSSWEDMKNKDSKVHHFKANSWGKEIDVYRSETSDTFLIGKNKLIFKSVSYMEGFSFWVELLMMFSGMDGMIGNQVFEDKRIYLDLNNKIISILE